MIQTKLHSPSSFFLQDLSYLNRDLNKVIMLDCKAKAVNLQRNNAFVLKEWDGDENDTTLFDLASFLQSKCHSSHLSQGYSSKKYLEGWNTHFLMGVGSENTELF